MRADGYRRHISRLYGVISLIIAVLICRTTAEADTSIQKISRTEELMDTYFTITVYSEDAGNAEAAITEAFNEIRRIESELSVYSEDSELAGLNRDKVLKNPSEDLMQNIERSLYYSKLTNGAFDITVQPVLELYNRAFNEEGSPPSAEMISRELEKVDYRKIIIKGNEIEVGKDQRITLGGIAKGYAAEKAVEVLRRHNISMALMDAGGNMRALGKKPDGMWHIAMEDPRDMSNYIAIIPLDNNAVSTSGDYERYFDEQLKYHHIINPRTGYSATELISVTIVTDNAFDADVLSTAVFVLGKERGMALIESLPDVEGLLVTREKEILRSSGFKEIKKN